MLKNGNASGLVRVSGEMSNINYGVPVTRFTKYAMTASLPGIWKNAIAVSLYQGWETMALFMIYGVQLTEFLSPPCQLRNSGI